MSADDTQNMIELERIVQETIETFTYAPEFDTIREINQYVAQIEHNYKTRHETYSSTMNDLTEGIQKLQKESAALNLSEFQLQKRDLESKKLRCEEKIAQLSRARLHTSQSIEKVRSQLAQLEKTKESYEVESGDDVPRLRHALDLYIQLSSMKWDFDAPSQLVGGTLFFNDRVKQFELNKGTTSPYDLTNKIWELLDS